MAVVTGYMMLEIRNICGYKKQSHFGKLFDMTHAAIGKIERGEASVSLEFLTMVSGQIGCKSSDFVTVVEKISEHLVSQGVTFVIHAPTSDTFDSLDSVTHEDIAEYITLDLKRGVHDLVKKLPEQLIDVKQITSELMDKSVSEVFSPPVTASGINAAIAGGDGMALASGAIPLSVYLINPVVGAVVGASLLLSKVINSNKPKAPNKTSN